MLWMVVHPFVQVLIYTLVLSSIMQAKLPGISGQYSYSIYLISGMLGWFLFSDIVGRLLTVFIDHGHMIKKVGFPKIILPIITLGHSLIGFTIMYIATMIIFVVMDHQSIYHLIWAPVLILSTILFSVGIGLSLGVLNTFIRDVGQITTISLQLLFWLTPIVYSLQMLPEEYRDFFSLNPVVLIIQWYQDVFAYNRAPDLFSLAIFTVASAFLTYLSVLMLRKSENKMADIL